MSGAALFFRVGGVWLLIVRGWALRYVTAEPPCWKGELQIGPLVIGWQR